MKKKESNEKVLHRAFLELATFGRTEIHKGKDGNLSIDGPDLSEVQMKVVPVKTENFHFLWATPHHYPITHKIISVENINTDLLVIFQTGYFRQCDIIYFSENEQPTQSESEFLYVITAQEDTSIKATPLGKSYQGKMNYATLYCNAYILKQRA